MARLTDKQRKFAELVAVGTPHWRAYREAYEAECMSTESVHVEASRTLRLPQVEAYLSELRTGAAEYARLDAARLYERTAELNAMAFDILKNDPRDAAAFSVFSRTSETLLKAINAREAQPTRYDLADPLGLGL